MDVVDVIDKIYFPSPIKNITRMMARIHFEFLEHNNFGNEIQKLFYVYVNREGSKR